MQGLSVELSYFGIRGLSLSFTGYGLPGLPRHLVDDQKQNWHRTIPTHRSTPTHDFGSALTSCTHCSVPIFPPSHRIAFLLWSHAVRGASLPRESIVDGRIARSLQVPLGMMAASASIIFHAVCRHAGSCRCSQILRPCSCSQIKVPDSKFAEHAVVQFRNSESMQFSNSKFLKSSQFPVLRSEFDHVEQLSDHWTDQPVVLRIVPLCRL